MSDARNAAKRHAAETAVERVRSGTIVGLGTGSTAALVVEAIGRKLARGDLTDIRGVPTSVRTLKLAEAAGIPLTSLNEAPRLDLTIDGADQVDPDGNLIKGGGGALLWEKIVAASSDRYVIVVDEGKLVRRLGLAFPLPVEVVPFGWRTHLASLDELGAEPAIRLSDDGTPYRTDEGHFILDCVFQDGISDPPAVQHALRSRPGIVETGLFLGFRPEVIVGRA